MQTKPLSVRLKEATDRIDRLERALANILAGQDHIARQEYEAEVTEAHLREGEAMRRRHRDMVRRGVHP